MATDSVDTALGVLNELAKLNKPFIYGGIRYELRYFGSDRRNTATYYALGAKFQIYQSNNPKPMLLNGLIGTKVITNIFDRLGIHCIIPKSPSSMAGLEAELVISRKISELEIRDRFKDFMDNPPIIYDPPQEKIIQDNIEIIELIRDPTTGPEERAELVSMSERNPALTALLIATKEASDANVIKLDEITSILKKPTSKEDKLREIIAKAPNQAIRQQLMDNIRSITQYLPKVNRVINPLTGREEDVVVPGLFTESDVQGLRDVRLIDEGIYDKSLYTNTISMDHKYVTNAANKRGILPQSYSVRRVPIN